MDKRVPRNSYHQEFRMGLWEGALKVQPRKSANCWTDGRNYLGGTWRMFVKVVLGGTLESNDEYNFED